jgi:hypothetical protein
VFNFVLGVLFNIESTTANPAKKRRERESFLPLYKFTVKTVSAFVPGPLTHFGQPSPAWGEKTPHEHIQITACLDRACSKFSIIKERTIEKIPTTIFIAAKAASNLVLGLSFNHESTTANPAKKRRERVFCLFINSR